jgi:hypothetical protein
MKKIYLINLILILLILGFSLSKFYQKTNFENNNDNKDVIELKSGIYKDLYFENLRKEGDRYYIKFSRQEEDEVFPDYCYQNGVFVENFENSCVRYGRPMKDKINPDIDLSKEYILSNTATVDLITYDERHASYFYNMSISTFYKYLNNTEEPPVVFYSFSSKDYEFLSFDVTFTEGEISNLRDIYRE